MCGGSGAALLGTTVGMEAVTPNPQGLLPQPDPEPWSP